TEVEMTLKFLVIVSMLLAPAHLLAQKAAEASKDTSVTAAEELEAIIIESDKLDDKTAVVNIKSRAAMLVSFLDPARSENMFLTLWKFTKDQTDEAFDKEQAKLLILKYLFSRNPKLARQLLAEQTRTKEPSLPSRAMGQDNEQELSTKLASQLLDADPSAAAGLLERSLSLAGTPAGVGALSRLRERDPFLSDYVAARALEGLATQPTIVSLPGLHLMGAYVFPGSEWPIPSAEVESSLQLLQ